MPESMVFLSQYFPPSFVVVTLHMSDMRGSSALLDEKSRAIHTIALVLADYQITSKTIGEHYSQLSSHNHEDGFSYQLH